MEHKMQVYNYVSSFFSGIYNSLPSFSSKPQEIKKEEKTQAPEQVATLFIETKPTVVEKFFGEEKKDSIKEEPKPIKTKQQAHYDLACALYANPKECHAISKPIPIQKKNHKKHTLFHPQERKINFSHSPTISPGMKK
jgi:hypothetical protein